VGVNARVLEMNEADAQQRQQQPKTVDPTARNGMPDPNNLEEVTEFFRERFRTASVTKVDDLGDLNKTDSMNVQHSKEYIQQMQQDNRSTFEKIYDQAMEKITNGTENENKGETIFYQEVQDATDDAVHNEVVNPDRPDVAVVNVTLPGGKTIMAPAREHIPYFLASYTILPTGLIQVREDITVVADGKKLKNGFIRMLRKDTVSRANVHKKIDFQLISVELNGQEVPHRLEEIGKYIYIKPQKPYELPSGVYTYTFQYLMDRKLWYYPDFSEFYVDVTGSYLNLLITSANAIVSVPDGKGFMTQNVIVGAGQNQSSQRAMIASLDSNALGFASVTPLLPGEGMHVLVSLDKNVFLEPDMNQRFVWFVTDYGDVLFAAAGLLAVLLSYWLSWRYLKKRKQTSGKGAGLDASVVRYLLLKKFDTRAFGTVLLEWYAKKIIDFEQHNEELLLVKKTDHSSSLNRFEKKALKELFGRDTVLPVSTRYQLKFKRSFKILEKGHKYRLKFLSLQRSIGYLIFSIAMLILSEVAIAMLSVNPLQAAFILFSATLTIGFYIWILKRKFKRRWVGWGVKTLAVLMILAVLFLTSIYIKAVSALMLACMVYTIFEFNELFSKSNGLAKMQNQELAELKKYLVSNAPTISRSQAFYGRQAYVFALELEEFYPENEHIEQGYRLDIMQRLIRMI
jgi:hypothetical protein